MIYGGVWERRAESSRPTESERKLKRRTKNGVDWTNWAQAKLGDTRSCASSQYVSQSSKSNKFDFSQASQLLLSQKKVMTFFWKGKKVRYSDVFHARGKRTLRTCFDAVERRSSFEVQGVNSNEICLQISSSDKKNYWFLLFFIMS